MLVADHLHREVERVDAGGELDVERIAVVRAQRQRAGRFVGGEQGLRGGVRVELAAEPRPFDEVGGQPVVVARRVRGIGEAARDHVRRLTRTGGVHGACGRRCTGEARRPQPARTRRADHTLRARRRALHERPPAQVGAADHRRRVGEVEPLRPAPVVLAHGEHARTGGGELQRLVDTRDEIDRLRPGAERVRRRGEGTDHVDDNHRPRDRLEFPTHHLPPRHRHSLATFIPVCVGISAHRCAEIPTQTMIGRVIRLAAGGQARVRWAPQWLIEPTRW